MEDDLFFARDSPTSRVRSETINITRLPSQKKVECLSLSSVRDACEAIKGSMPSPEEAEELDRIFLLKEKLVAEIRRNHDLSIVVEDLDNKIALLVKNRISLQEVISAVPKQTKSSSDEGEGSKIDTAVWAPFLHTLRTNPEFLARTAFTIEPKDFDPFLRFVMLSLWGDQTSKTDEFFSLVFLQMVLEQEIGSTPAINTVMRGNSGTSKLLVAYAKRRDGEKYLKSVLEGPLTLLKDNDDLNEVTPSKVYRELQMKNDDMKPAAELSVDEQAEHPKVVATIKERLARIEKVTETFLDAIFDSVHKMPYGLRFLSQGIKNLTIVNFPEASEKEINSLIGGYLFLRYFCPSVAAATALKVVNFPLSTNAKRTLVFVSKALQNVSNQVTFGKKEAHMAGLNGLVDRYQAKLYDFFNTITEVEGITEKLKMNKYHNLTMASDPTLNSSTKDLLKLREFILRSLEAIDPENIITPLIKRTPPIESDTDDDIRIVLKNESRGDVESATVSSDMARLEMTVREVYFALSFIATGEMHDESGFDDMDSLTMSSMEIPLANIPSDLEGALLMAKSKAEAEGYATGIQHAVRALELIEDLDNAGISTKVNGYNEILSAVTQATGDRLSDVALAVDERRDLDLFLESVRGQRKQLEEQVESYKEYLANCRSSQHDLNQPPARRRRSSSVTITEKGRLMDPVTFPLSHLKKKGIILLADVEKKKTDIVFSASSANIIKCQVFHKGCEVVTLIMGFDELLAAREKEEDFVRGPLRFSPSLLVEMLNSLLSKSANKKKK